MADGGAHGTVQAPEHRAAAAWRAFSPRAPVPLGVTALKETQRAAVYRLDGVGPGGAPVVAKRRRIEIAEIERRLCAEILPRLALSRIECLGFLEEPDGAFAWLFLEHVDGAPYDSEDPSHRSLAARWIGALHTRAAPLADALALPERQPGETLEALRSARVAMDEALRSTRLEIPERGMLERTISHLDRIEARWSSIVDWAGGLPRTLAHGDFTSKNVRVRAGRTGPELVAMDWEIAGIGSPAADLAAIDLGLYRLAVAPAWPSADATVLERAARAGLLFRLLSSVRWASMRLPSGHFERPFAQLSAYESWLSDAVHAAGIDR